MRILHYETSIFDTRVDTKKIFVPMNHKFVLHNYKNKRAERAIFLHVTSHSKRIRIPTGLKINEKLWNTDKGFAYEKTKEGVDLNLILNNLESKITEIKTNYRLSETFLSLEKFEEEFRNGFPRMDFIAFFNAQLELEKPIMNKNTHKAQKSVYNKLRKWKEQIPFSEITFDFIQKFKNHIVEKGHAKTTMFNNLKVIKKYLNIAANRGIKFPLNTKQIACGSTSGNRVDLDAAEIKKIVDYFYSGFIRQNHILPAGNFLLACFTGVRISDAQQLTNDNIHNEKIRFTSVKTGKRQIIAINTTVNEIIEKCPEILSIKISDQEINRRLKEIAGICDIKKTVTFHVARHSFATNYLRLGGSVQRLQKILGHSDIKETMIYVHIVQEELDREIFIMDQLLKEDSPSSD